MVKGLDNLTPPLKMANQKERSQKWKSTKGRPSK